MNPNKTRRMSLVAAGTLLTGTAAAAMVGLLGAGPAGAATPVQSAHLAAAQARTVAHDPKGSSDPSSHDRNRDKSGDKSRDRGRDQSGDRNRDTSRDRHRDTSRDHSRDH